MWDREGALHGGDGRPSEAFAAFCGRLRVGWRFCEPADPQAKGVVERLQGYIETSFEPGRRFANELDFADQLDAWFVKAPGRLLKARRYCCTGGIPSDYGTALRLGRTGEDPATRLRESPDADRGRPR